MNTIEEIQQQLEGIKQLYVDKPVSQDEAITLMIQMSDCFTQLLEIEKAQQTEIATLQKEIQDLSYFAGLGSK